MSREDSQRFDDPKDCIRDLFGKEYIVDESKMPRHQWSLDFTGECFSDPRSDHYDRAFSTFCGYVHFRQKGVNMGIDPVALFFPEDLRRCIFYHWSAMTQATKDACFRVFESTHLWCIRERGTWYRPEFAFIVEFTGSFVWAIPHRELLLSCEPNLLQLEELFDQGSTEEFWDIFFGEREDLQPQFDGAVAAFQRVFLGMSVETKPQPGQYAWETHHNHLEGGTCALDYISCRADFYATSPGLAARLRRELGMLLGKS